MGSYSSQQVLNYLVRMLETLSEMDYPIVFKGAVVLKTITDGSLTTSRMTRDLDAEWKSSNISNAQLLKLMKMAVVKSGIKGLDVRQYREFSLTKSAGFNFYLNEDYKEVVFSMDIQVGVENGYFVTYYTRNGVRFKGYSIDKMVADKISATSTSKIKRRTKDIYDLYLLSNFQGYTTYNIITIMKDTNRKLEDFYSFLNELEGKSGLIHAYSKMRDVENKPDFNTVYNKVKQLCMPFITKSYYHSNYKWVKVDGVNLWVKV